VAAPPTPRVDRTQLIVGLARAPDLAAAGRTLFDLALKPLGLERGVLLVVSGGELVPHASWACDADAVAELRLPLADGSPLADSLRSGEIVTLNDPFRLGADPPGLSRMLALPVLPPDPAGTPAVLLCEATELAAGAAPVLTELMRDAAGILARCLELDSLREVSRQLARRRELLTSIVNTLPDPVLVTSSDNQILLENRRAETLLTTSEADSEGRRRAVEINNLLLSSFLSRSDAEARESGSRELNLVDPTEGGDLLFEVISTSLSAPAYPDGTAVSVLREVTDLKQATAELERQFKRVRQAELKSRRERDRLNLILETVGDPILVTDDKANIILMNREAERLFDVPSGTDLKSKRRQDVRANDTKFSSLISDFALSSDVTRVAEIHLADPETGTELPSEVVSGKIFNERAEMAAVVSIVHDLTKVVENERLAAELARLNEGLEDRVRAATTQLEERNRQLEWQRHELERAYRLKSEFLASMSHELRTPINALLGYTSLMRDRIYGDLTARQEEALQRMYAASQHLLELVNDVLDLAKIEAGKMPVHSEPVDLALLVREVSPTIDPMIRAKQLEFRVRVEPDLPVVHTDRIKVKQVLLNLLSNAVKFTHRGNVELRVQPAAKGRGVEIAVQDTGIGISRADQDTIFEDFRQVDQSSTREFGGTGLGLSITRKLLSLLGGTIRVNSCPGEGSTFTVWLPPRSEPVSPDEQMSRTTLGRADTVVRSDDSGPDC
jgi:PAS domain S-box-containing protein